MSSFERVRSSYLSRIVQSEKLMRESCLETALTGAVSDVSTPWVNNHQVTEEDQHTEAQQLAKNVLRVLQLLCEGHNLAMQRFLREQRESGTVSAKSLNLVALVGSILAMYVKILHKDNLELGFQVIGTH